MTAQRNSYQYPIYESMQRRVVTVYDRGGYIAQVYYPCETVVVCRKGPNGAHCGEKHASQDWREVRLRGVPDETRVEIVQACKDYAKAT
jgi:hypothetical protein